MKLTDIVNTPFRELTEERLRELADVARTEMDEWGKFANDIRVELSNRKIAKCDKHDFYPAGGVDGFCGDCESFHQISYSVPLGGWFESCSQYGPIIIDEKELGTERFMEHCKKCGFYQKGILNCEKKDWR